MHMFDHCNGPQKHGIYKMSFEVTCFILATAQQNTNVKSLQRSGSYWNRVLFRCL